MGATEAFARSLRQHSSPELRSRFQPFDTETHGSIPLPSLHAGLRFLFEGYKPSWAAVLKDPEGVARDYERVCSRLEMDALPWEGF